jgi:hypothetical protein
MPRIKATASGAGPPGTNNSASARDYIICKLTMHKLTIAGLPCGGRQYTIVLRFFMRAPLRNRDGLNACRPI